MIMTDATYTDEDLVYIDPEKRKVIGKVEWSAAGDPKKLEMPGKEEVEEEEQPVKGRRPRKKRKRYYPWGTYKSMKRLYRVEGKEKEIENYRPLDDAIVLAVQEPYWD